jgi:hypothetical protein
MDDETRSFLRSAFELLKEQHAEIFSLREELKVLREALRRLDHGTFDSALEQAEKDRKRLNISPDADEQYRKFDELIQKL